MPSILTSAQAPKRGYLANYDDSLAQWYSTSDTRTAGGTRKHLTGNVKLKNIFRYKH
jgi:hypothetical protein